MKIEENRKIQHIAEKVKFLRTYEGMSIGDVGEALRLPKQRIAFLENGAYKADLQDVIRYCDFFGLDYERFLFDKFPEFKAAYVADDEKMLKTIGYSV